MAWPCHRLARAERYSMGDSTGRRRRPGLNAGRGGHSRAQACRSARDCRMGYAGSACSSWPGDRGSSWSTCIGVAFHHRPGRRRDRGRGGRSLRGAKSPRRCDPRNDKPRGDRSPRGKIVQADAGRIYFCSRSCFSLRLYRRHAQRGAAVQPLPFSLYQAFLGGGG